MHAGYGVIVPVTPTLMTDFFASRHSDVYIHCEDYTSQKAPPSCRDAHSDAVNWSSASSFVSNSILSFALVSAALAWSACLSILSHIRLCHTSGWCTQSCMSVICVSAIAFCIETAAYNKSLCQHQTCLQHNSCFCHLAHACSLQPLTMLHHDSNASSHSVM